MVSDGLLTNASSGYCTTTFDVIYIFAVDDSADALLNVCSSSFTAVTHGSPTFSANNGFTGTTASTTIWIDSGFNPVSAAGNFALNSAHISVWSATANAQAGSSGVPAGGYDGTNDSTLAAYIAGGSSFAGRLNEICCNTEGVGTTNIGLITGVRTGSLAANELIYQNSTSITQTPKASNALTNKTFNILGQNDNGSPDFGFGNRVSAVSFGGALTSTQVTNFCHRLNTFLNTQNGTSTGIC